MYKTTTKGESTEVTGYTMLLKAKKIKCPTFINKAKLQFFHDYFYNHKMIQAHLILLAQTNILYIHNVYLNIVLFYELIYEKTVPDHSTSCRLQHTNRPHELSINDLSNYFHENRFPSSSRNTINFYSHWQLSSNSNRLHNEEAYRMNNDISQVTVFDRMNKI